MQPQLTSLWYWHVHFLFCQRQLIRKLRLKAHTVWGKKIRERQTIQNDLWKCTDIVIVILPVFTTVELIFVGCGYIKYIGLFVLINVTFSRQKVPFSTSYYSHSKSTHRKWLTTRTAVVASAMRHWNCLSSDFAWPCALPAKAAPSVLSVRRYAAHSNKCIYIYIYALNNLSIILVPPLPLSFSSFWANRVCRPHLMPAQLAIGWHSNSDL